MRYKNIVILDTLNHPRGLSIHGHNLIIANGENVIISNRTKYYNIDATIDVPVNEDVISEDVVSQNNLTGLLTKGTASDVIVNPLKGFVVSKTYQKDDQSFINRFNPLTLQMSDPEVTFSLKSAGSDYIICTHDGLIAGYSKDVFNSSFIIGYKSDGADYNSLSIYDNKLYVVNLTTAAIEVIDSNWNLLSDADYKFHDKNLPIGYVPFSIRIIDSEVFVSYVLSRYEGYEKETGIVNVFTYQGKFVRRQVDLCSGLSTPYGMIQQLFPVEQCKKDYFMTLLVANNNSSEISRYTLTNGLRLEDLEICGDDLEGLWDIKCDVENQSIIYYTSKNVVGKLVEI